METNGSKWKLLEATVSYMTWARLTPTLTHVVTHNPVTSGAEGRAMSRMGGVCGGGGGGMNVGGMLGSVTFPLVMRVASLE